ncbi:unnamed protein product [Lymnaea stagnalis]|uniref:Uncharacterized protein n=1 Tax=Lymnaea stagnalis TaxID=6523 RepID=A0AAV2HIL5_LYMST
MKLMGLSSTMYWISCLLGALPFGMIITIALVGSCCIPFSGAAGPIFNSSPILLFIFYVMYTVNITTFAFLLSCFINKARNAVVASATLFVATSFGVDLAIKYMTSRIMTLLVGTIVPQTGLDIFLKQLVKMELRDRTMTFSNFMDNPSVPHQSGLEAVLILILNSTFNMLIVAYVDAVNPGEFGVPQPFNFFLTVS